MQSTTWIMYWSLSSLKLLGVNDTYYIEKLVENSKNNFKFIYDNLDHIGNLYSALATLYEYKRLDCVQEELIYNLLIKHKNRNGSFAICENGESDIRGVYCALAICKFLDIKSDLLIENNLEYILSCQTYEGGFASVPGAEAHGGYTYCAIASLVMLKQLDKCDVWKLCEFLAARQLDNGQSNGRTNKMADSCYGFWIGASIKMISDCSTIDINLINQDFIEKTSEQIMNCQVEDGGFRDKNENEPDLHHTCYGLYFLGMYNIQESFIYTIDPVLGVVMKKTD
ncbi:hypothetical protein COBT_000079 [Conglomerata obtusa]